jgi:hypothetical protein
VRASFSFEADYYRGSGTCIEAYLRWKYGQTDISPAHEGAQPQGSERENGLKVLETQKVGSRTCKPNCPGHVAAAQVIESQRATAVNDVSFDNEDRICITPASQAC